MSNNHVPAALRDSFAWFAPAIATGNHLAAQNDEPEPGELTATDVGEEVERLQREALAADLADSRDPWAERRRREQEALKVERVLSPHLWEQS